MRKKTKITENDLEIFRKAVAGTKPLVHKKIRLKSSKKEEPRKNTQKKSSETTLNLSENRDLLSVKSEDYISYHHPSISQKILRKLRKGQYNVEAKLDLHGMLVEEAREAVLHFLQQSLFTGKRVVLIIHGKGRRSQMPILKNKLNHWLREVSEILAFCSADSIHGNRGAIYVLLKRASQEDIFE